MDLKGFFTRLRGNKEIKIDEKVLLSIIKKHGVKEWFYYAQFKERENYWNSWETSFFLAGKLPSNANILETGCGPALNLIWFYQNGFKNIYGVDLEEHFISAGKELCETMNIPCHLWTDNCTSPAVKKDVNFDAVIALNWTYLDEKLELYDFLKYYSDTLNQNGYICIDLIDRSFNTQINNQYATADWNKPETERRSSEYKKRYSEEEVKVVLHKLNLKLIKRIAKAEKIPKVLYIIQK